MTNLITRERALRNIASLTSPTAAQALMVDAAVAAVSTAAQKYCRRNFQPQEYDELYHGNGQERLLLRQFPVQAISRVAYDVQPLLTAKNSLSTVQRAWVQVTTDGLKLTHVSSGTATVNELDFTDYATISLIAAAITAVGNGWTGTVASSTYSDWPSDELRAIQGSFYCKDVDTALKAHVCDLDSYEVNQEVGYITRSCPFWGGVNAWRVTYTAGFDEPPEDVQEACAQWAAELYNQAQRDPNVQQQTEVDSNAGTSTFTGWFDHKVAPPRYVAQLLAPYRKRSV